MPSTPPPAASATAGACAIVGALLDGDRTFGELGAEIDGIAPTILTARLRALQGAALVTATPYERRPLRMRYGADRARPAPRRGHRLARRVGRRPGRRDADRPVHRTCGTPVETRPWCPTCDRAVDDEAGDDLIWC